MGAQLVVAIAGLAIVLIGILGASAPRQLRQVIRSFSPTTRLGTGIVVRTGLGIALFVAAPTSRFPAVLAVLGAVSLLAAVSTAFLGPSRLDAWALWWMGRTDPVLRAWSLVAGAFGAFLVYAVSA